MLFYLGDDLITFFGDNVQSGIFWGSGLQPHNEHASGGIYYDLILYPLPRDTIVLRWVGF